jgi:exopolysaccharide biosynthesis polyprenyl glycosylphosphotransferase
MGKALDTDARAAQGPGSPLGTARGGERLVHSRHRDRDYGLRRALLVADWTAISLAFVSAVALPGNRPLANALWLLPTLPAWAILFRAYGLYQRPLRRFEPTHLDDVSSLFHAMIIGTLGLWVFYKLLPLRKLELEEIVIFGLLALPMIGAARVGLRRVNLRLRGPERVLVAAPIGEVKVLQRKLRNHPEYEMRVVSALPLGASGASELGLRVLTGIDQVMEEIAAGSIDHLLVQLNPEWIPNEEVAELMRASFRAGVRFGAFSPERSLLHPGVEINHIEGTGFLSYQRPVLSRSSRLLKRGMDLLVAGGLLAVFALPMALISLAIKLEDGGDVLFRQIRVGKDGRRFRLIKFRTMEADADTRVGELMDRSIDPDWLIIENDPRVTRVGRFLRKTSLDELPQLWNVLGGEMSMVGPRPLPERDDAAVRGWGRHRLDCTPGVTGYWQVLGRNSIPFREMVEIDYAYVAGWSMWQDVKLLVRTAPVVLRRRGAN